jgi:peptide/nickel transport system substrate-binding protein
MRWIVLLPFVRRLAFQPRHGILLGLCLSVALCAGARSRPHYGGAIRVEVDGDPMQRPSGMARRLVLDGLTRLDEQGQTRPSLAEHWTSENNNHRWQFRLRAGVVFHDGKPLTSIAVAASLTESCRIAACPWSGVHAVGQSLIITSDSAIPELSAMLAEDRFRIQAIASDESDGASLPNSILIGTGPYRLAPSQSKAAVRLEANDECWQGRPFLDVIDLIPRQAGRDFWMDLNSTAASKGIDLVALEPSEVRQATQRRLTLVTRPAVSLLALQIREESLNPQLRAALALAIDRSAIYQVIFQKQGEVTASLLPASVSGYSFLFPAERDLAHAQAQRGGLTPQPLTIAADDSEPMQLAAARIALNLHDAGFNVRALPPLHDGRIANADLTLRTIPLSSGQTEIALDTMLRIFGQTATVPANNPNDPTAAYKIERTFLDQHTVIPILYLPRTWAVSSRLRDLRLSFDGTPDLANASLNTTSEDAP